MMTITATDEYILPTLVRYIDRYNWSWCRTKRLINMYYGTEYTEEQLKRLYAQNK